MTKIRKAELPDIEGIQRLLFQVNSIHAAQRPDLFKTNGIKYSGDELAAIIDDPNRPVFVAADSNGTILGYVFCVVEFQPETSCLQQVKSLYIDDLCVDSLHRGKHIGSDLYYHAMKTAREMGCRRITLHAWNFNESAFGFYEKIGMTPLVTTMEQLVE